MDVPDPDGIRALFVTADAADGAAIANRLADEGIDLDAAVVTRPGDALERVDAVDCVVSEMSLPGMDGLDLLAAIRERRPSLPFVLVPEEGSESLASDAMAAGATDYVPRDAGGPPTGLLANRIANVVERFRAERRATEMERVNAVLRDVDATLVRADTVGDVVQSVCDVLADSEPYRFAWIGEYHPEERALHPVAWAGIDAGFLEHIPVGEGETLPQDGPGPRAIETRELQVAQDVERSEAFEPYLDAVDERGFRSVATVPIEVDGDLFGLLAIYADRERAFDVRERDLLTAVGQDIGHAIDGVRAKTALHRYREAVDHAGHAICLTSTAGVIEYVNSAFVEQTGYDASAVVGRKLSTIQDVGPAEVTRGTTGIESEMTWNREFVAERADGREYTAEQTIAPIVTDGGDLDGFVVVQTDVTRRREREEALRAEKEMLDGVLETSPTGIVVLDPAGTIERANERAASLLGVPVDRLEGRQYDDEAWTFVDEDGEPVPTAEQPWATVAETAEPLYDYEVAIAVDDRPQRWLSINGAPLFDPDGDLERLVFTFDDVTAEKEARSELREANQALTAVIEAAPAAIVARDPDRGITLWNEGAERIFGWTADEVRGMDRPPFLPADARFDDHERRVGRGERIAGKEVQRVTKDGETRTVLLSVAPIEDEDGELIRTLAVLVDITERKQREKELRSFERAVEYAAHSIYMTDPEGVIEYVNPAFEEQTGYSRDEAIGATPAILNSGVHDDAFFADMWETLLDGEVWKHEIVNQRKDGTQIHVDQSVAPVVDEEGEIERFVAVNHDVTDRKRYERRLERQNERLEEFASVVSHDLRNPLNVAMGHLEMIETRDEHVAAIERSLARIEAIVRDVLTLAREGQSVDDTEPVDLARLARRSWEQIDAPSATFVAEHLPQVRAEPQRLQRILENLFRNAVEHAGPDVTVEMGELDEGFYVEDDGPGIAMDDRERVFQSGYTQSETGTGLGLSIVRRLTEAHDWTVVVREGTDGGARFEFTGVPILPPGDA
ncbi:MAG: PAS domain S-box protein [Halanaeroarchaeum sp.]